MDNFKILIALFAVAALLFGCASQGAGDNVPAQPGQQLQPEPPSGEEADPGVELIPEIDDVPIDDGS